MLNNDEAKKEVDKELEKLIYETNEYTYSFKNFQTIKTFGRDIYEGKITIEEANEYQTDLLAETLNFRKNTKPRNQEKKQKEFVLEACINLLRVEKKFLTLLKAKYFR